jgi:transcription antitermination protein NusB
MTRDRNNDNKHGGSGTGARKARASKIPATKAPATKAPASESRATESPATSTPATKPPAVKKTPVARSAGTQPNGGRKANKRGAARLAAVQALYQMDMTGAGLNEILAQFESHWLGREVEGEQYLPAEAAFFRDIVSGVVDVQRDLDPRIDAALEATWPLKRIEAILRSVLRAGAYELQRRTDVPARVVVSEYVDVAHAFVDKTETGMVNAVLDRLARNVRAAEFG